MEGFGAELNNAEIVGFRNQLLFPEIVKQRRDISVEDGNVGWGQPRVDKLAVAVRTRIEGTSQYLVYPQKVNEANLQVCPIETVCRWILDI